MKYVEQTKELKKGFFKKVVKEVPEEKTSKEFKIVKEISEEVFSLTGSIADNAKSIQLLTGLVKILYDLFDDDKKDSIPDDKRLIIEHTLEKFEETTTLSDIYLNEEGVPFIDRLLERQGQIAEIVLRHKGAGDE